MSGAGASTAHRLVHRRRRTTPAVISALLVLAVALIAGWAAIQTLVTGSPLSLVTDVRDLLRGTAWGSVWVLLIGAAVALLGLWWLVLALKPGPPTGVPVTTPDGDAVRDAAIVLTRSALARLASARAADVDGVERVASTVGRRRVRLRVDTTLHDSTALAAAVRTAVTERFTACGVTPVPAVTVAVRHRDA